MISAIKAKVHVGLAMMILDRWGHLGLWRFHFSQTQSAFHFLSETMIKISHDTHQTYQN